MTGFNLGDYALFIDLDVGKLAHHATALTSDAEKVYDKELPNTQAKLQQVLTDVTVASGSPKVKDKHLPASSTSSAVSAASCTKRFTRTSPLSASQ